MKQVIIAGMGPGGRQCITQEVKTAIDCAEVLIGSRRLVQPYSYIDGDADGNAGRRVYDAVTADAIIEIIEHEDAQRFVVMMSGDTGFYSGTRKLADKVKGRYELKILPGISSVIYLSSKIGQPWESAALVSLHGKRQCYIPVIMQNEWTYILTGGNVAQICQKIEKTGHRDIMVWIGENLSYANEKISSGAAAEFTEYEASGLAVIAVNNTHPCAFVSAGIPDDRFIHPDVTISRREIRACIVSRMAVADDDCVYVIGAGDGSVAAELALHALSGTVYAIEKRQERCGLIAKNADQFGLDNIKVINADAADIIDRLPVPDAVFIGGSISRLDNIINIIIEKNVAVRIVMTVYESEMLDEAVSLLEKNNMCVNIVQIAVADIKKHGNHKIMSDNNPVFIIDGWH